LQPPNHTALFDQPGIRWPASSCIEPRWQSTACDHKSGLLLERAQRLEWLVTRRTSAKKNPQEG